MGHIAASGFQKVCVCLWGAGGGNERQQESLILDTEQTPVSTASILGC